MSKREEKVQSMRVTSRRILLNPLRAFKIPYNRGCEENKNAAEESTLCLASEEEARKIMKGRSNGGSLRWSDQCQVGKVYSIGTQGKNQGDPSAEALSPPRRELGGGKDNNEKSKLSGIGKKSAYTRHKTLRLIIAVDRTRSKPVFRQG